MTDIAWADFRGREGLERQAAAVVHLLLGGIPVARSCSCVLIAPSLSRRGSTVVVEREVKLGMDRLSLDLHVQ